MMRNGDDYLSQPLSASSTLNDCALLCCSAINSRCVAFSYNNPQPSNTSVGGASCLRGGVCCMLKDGVGTMQSNSWPGAVRTGTSSTPDGPAPTPPFAPSVDIVDVVFGDVNYWSGEGDTWPTATDAAGNTFGWCCDASNGGNFSPMSLWRLDGDPASPGGIVPAQVAHEPIDFAHLCAYLGPTGSYPKINVKPGGMMVAPPTPGAPNGTLLVGVSCMNYGDDAAFARQHNLAGFVAASVDGGATWTNVTAVGAFAGRFAAPIFVSCGRAHDACADVDGGVAYVFFAGAFDDAAYWDNNDAMFLGRVAPAEANIPASYEFYAGLDGAGAPRWTTDASQAQPALEFGNMLGENAVSYHPGLGKYLVANFGFVDHAGQPRPWHTQPFMSPHRTQLLLLEADHAWGPWRVFYRDDDSALAPGLYTPTFPSAYMRPPTGTAAELVMFFACLDGAPNCRYTLNYVNVTLSIRV